MPSSRQMLKARLEATVRRMVLRAAAVGIATVAAALAGLAAAVAIYGVLCFWLAAVWALAATFAILAGGAGVIALALALMSRPPPPPPPSIWDWLLMGDLAGRPNGGLRGWAMAAVRELLRRGRHARD